MVSVTEKKLVFFHEMRNADTDEVSAVMLLTGVHFDSRARKACALPDEVRARARKLLVAHDLPWPV